MKQQQHDSPAEFVCQWIAENRFRNIGYVGSFPGLPDALAGQITLVECNGLTPWQQTESVSSLQAMVVSGDLADLTQQELTQLLAGYRNALVQGILVLCGVDGSSGGLSENQFYGLGFKKIAEFPHPQYPLMAFEYNLRNYNHKRLWNNSKYWANPENFGKYWW